MGIISVTYYGFLEDIYIKVQLFLKSKKNRLTHLSSPSSSSTNEDHLCDTLPAQHPSQNGLKVTECEHKLNSPINIQILPFSFSRHTRTHTHGLSHKYAYASQTFAALHATWAAPKPESTVRPLHKTLAEIHAKSADI